MKIFPAILEKDWQEIEAKIKLARVFSNVIHVDVIDSVSSKTPTFLDPRPFAEYTKDLFFEVHFITEDPLSYLEEFAKAGFRRFIAQIEKVKDQEEFIAKGEEFGEVGFAIDDQTPLSKIIVDLFDLDALLVMTVKAGESGQEFKEENLGKVKDLKNLILAKSIPSLIIGVDGGVNKETITDIKKGGADFVVANSAIFNGNPPENYKELLSLSTE